MTTNDWQSRLLSDDELQKALASLGALEGMQVLQRQLELRAQTHEASGELRGEVSSHLDLGFTDAIPATVAEETVTIAPEDEAAGTQTEATAPVPSSVASADIAGNLNALFANRQQIKVEAPVAIPIAEVARELPLAEGYNPVPLASNTTSFFIPTFTNPLPGTESIAVVTPMVQPVDPAKVKVAEAEITSPESAATEATTEPEVSEEPATQESPVAASSPTIQVAEWTPAEDLPFEIPSAEEAITAFEEADTTSTAQPNLVDDVILAVGGVSDSAETEGAPASPTLAVSMPDEEPAPEAPTTVDGDSSRQEPATQASGGAARRQRSGLARLIATWNGTGNLLFLIAAGYVAHAMGFTLATILAGAFGALAVTGFGFGTAALSAKRGAQPQATLSRAAFGVRAAAVPLAVVTIAGYAITALASTSIVTGIHFFFPSMPGSIWGVHIEYVLLGALLIASALATGLDGSRRLLMTRVVAYLSFAWLAVVLGLGIATDSTTYSFGSVNPQQALALASTLLIVVSLIWGTSAADETPQLAADVHPAKLLATGLLSHSIIGTLAVWAGYAFASATWTHGALPYLGAVFAVAAVAAFSHQIRRIADSYSGFGLVRTRWWVVIGSLVIVAIGSVCMWLFVPANALWPAVSSLLPVAGVPVIAWLATYGVDTVLRRADYHEVSLLRDYGFYGRIRVANLAGWLFATVAGFGFVQSNVPGFTWLGYIAMPLGLSTTGLQADTGVWIAFAIGVIAPLFTIGAIRQQEAEGEALANRHKDLINVLGEL